MGGSTISRGFVCISGANVGRPPDTKGIKQVAPGIRSLQYLPRYLPRQVHLNGSHSYHTLPRYPLHNVEHIDRRLEESVVPHPTNF